MTDETTLLERLRKVHAEMVAQVGHETPGLALVREAADELEDWEKAFELFAAANRRATALWHAAHPTQTAILPDQGKMIDWLCDELEANREAVNAAAEMITEAAKAHEMSERAKGR